MFRETGALIRSVNHTYSSAGQLTQLTTPSGQAITCYYSNGKVTAISVNNTPLIALIAYDPFGPITQWTWGNGTQSSRTYDEDGYLTTNNDAGATNYTFNLDGSIATQTLDSSAPLNLTTGLQTFTNASTSNKLNSISGAVTRSYTYDSDGHTLSDGSRTFTYNVAGRLVTATNNSITTAYSYNALGQRVKKSNTNGTTYFAYDEAGHLLGEYDQQGNLIQELVWLGDIPVATIRTDQSSGSVGVFYIHTDHLNAPAKITRPSDNAIIWRWDHDPYGNGQPNEDPDGNGLSLVFNLRFPGQYYDAETGLNYNYFRDYDPTTGRYIESDPIGLAAGVNTYAYVGENPLSFFDPNGLDETKWDNTSGGRSRWDGPTNGNWGGKCWSGGQYSCDGHPIGKAPPTDSADRCYMHHDNCYDKCNGNKECLKACDSTLVKELKALSDDPKKWSERPRKGTEGDSARYRGWAIKYFGD